MIFNSIFMEEPNKGFRHYGKIHRLGREEVEGILVGKVAVQEKVDGANTSIWVGEDGKIHKGSRNNDVTGGTFNGFCEYVDNHDGINKLLKLNPNFRLYGEWLVKHTVSYKETAYKKFYLFDIYHNDAHEWFDLEHVKEVASDFGIDAVPFHGYFENPTIEQLTAFVGKTEFGDRGEGIVIKNLDFVNSFGDMCYAKIVTESFKEDNGVAFGGNNKHSDTYNEMYVVNKYMTLARVKKVMDKIQPQVNEKLDMKHIPRIIATCYHDMLTEEIWDIQGRIHKIDFITLKRISDKKAKQVFVDIINDDVSVHDQQNG